MADMTYPWHREADVALRDGSTVHVRPVRPDDADRLRAFLEGLSPESRFLRFFTGSPNLASATRWATEADFDRRYSLVATSGTDGRIVAHAGYQVDADDPEVAEVAFAVADERQGHGLGTLMLGQLAEVADAAGITCFTAAVRPENHRMLAVLRDSGFPITQVSVPGEVHASLPTSLSEAALARFERREQVAAIAALRTVVAPRTVAVVGASRRRGTPGGEVFHNLLATGFTGTVHPVNAHTDVVQAVAAHRSIRDVPGPVDLAVVVVPAAAVIEVAEDCAAAGVRALVVLSAGFAETGADGLERQRALLRVCRDAGMRLVGPNCIGVLNTDPAVRLNAQFGPSFPDRGPVGFLSQSGALGLAIIDHAAARGIGLSSFVSIGNKADLSGNDLLDYWEDDPATDVILLYLESFGNPRRFARIARRVGRSKPIVAVKSGRSPAGARATSSHTGALLQAADTSVDALFRQAGVIRTETLSELFDVAGLLANQPLPAGDRVGIVTNAGGPGVLCADACAAAGLQVAVLSSRLQAQLRLLLPAQAAVANPVDTLAAAPPDRYGRALELVAASGEVDAVVAVYIPPLAADHAAVADAIRSVGTAVAGRMPLLTVFMSASGAPAELRGDGTVVPSYAFPEEAVRALAHATTYATWRTTPAGAVPDLSDLRRDEAAALVATVLADAPDGRWLGPGEVQRLLGCYGLPLIASRTVTTPDDAAAAAAALGGPVAIKAVAPQLVHKSDVGGVRLGLTGAAEVARAADAMARAVTAAGHDLRGFVVQPMADPGVELLVGVAHDTDFGPVIVCGAGGTTVELLHDVSVRITPISDRDAADMVRSLATFPLLDGYRGAPRADVAAVEDVLLRVSALVEAHREVAELDANPVIAGPSGTRIVDARVRVAPVAPPRPLAARRNP